MRALFIIGGLVLIQAFSWLIYIFGAFLIVTGIKLGLTKESETSPENNFIVRLFKRYIPLTKEYENDQFFIKKHGKLLATPLFIVLLAIETSDLIFALDSIPAIIGITTDIIIVYTSNIFAVLGLRSLYFALAGMMGLFYYLHYGLAIILIFIGLKMLLSGFFHLPIFLTLGVICLILTASILLSLIKKNPNHTQNKS
jgi:tellurite resistance protein TerC